jgi:hypothetical protein
MKKNTIGKKNLDTQLYEVVCLFVFLGRREGCVGGNGADFFQFVFWEKGNHELTTNSFKVGTNKMIIN